MFSIVIDGTDKTSIVSARTLRYFGQADRRQNLSVSINTKANTYMPKIGQDIKLYSSASGTLIFGGVIKTLNKTKLEPMQNSGAYVQVDITSDGYNSIPARRTTWLNFTTNETGNYMSALRSLVLNSATFGSENIGLGNITSGITIDSEYYSVDCQSVKDIFDDLATISGCKWYIDNTKALNFVSEDTVTTANHTISATNTTTNLIHNITVTESLENYCNKVFVAGEIMDDGNLLYVTAQLTSAITERASAEGTANSSGVYGFVIRDSNIDSLTAASTVADNHLKKYGYEPQEISFYSYEVDWVAGTQVLVNLPEFGMTAAVTCLIEEVTITSEASNLLKSYVRCTKRNSASFSTQKLGGGVEWFERLLAKDTGTTTKVSSTGTSGGGGTGLVDHYEATTTATATVTTSETTITSKAFTLLRPSDIHMTFSAYMNTTSAITVTGKTYLQEGTATVTTPKTYQPQQNLSGNQTFAYNEFFQSVSAGTTTITVKLINNTGTATINTGMCAMNLLVFPRAITPVTTAESTTPAGATDGYAAGGFDGSLLSDNDEYTPDSWASKTGLPDYGRSLLAASTINSKGYVYGGGSSGAKQDCDEYNPDAWTNKTNMPTPARYGLTASTISDKGYVYGGYTGSRIQDCDEYNPDTWTNKTDLPTPGRENAAASTINSKGYVYCGRGSSQLKDCDEYNPDTWTNKTDAPTPTREGLRASTISNKGYIYGGVGADFYGDCDEYDASGDSWANKTDMPAPTRYVMAACTISGKGYVYGGYGGGARLRDCDEYDASGNSWANKTDMPTPARNNHAAFEL